jgi:hypothetical protein
MSYGAPVEQPLGGHPGGGPVPLADIDSRQRHDPELGYQRLGGAYILVARTLDCAPGGRVHGAVRVVKPRTGAPMSSLRLARLPPTSAWSWPAGSPASRTCVMLCEAIPMPTSASSHTWLPESNGTAAPWPPTPTLGRCLPRTSYPRIVKRMLAP